MRKQWLAGFGPHARTLLVAIVAAAIAAAGTALADPSGGSQVQSAHAARALHGKRGPRGPRGRTGHAGNQGPIGPQGPAGPQGVQGSPGATGAQGAPGPKGATGAAGSPGSGTQGSTGPAGSTGATGPTGTQGPAGGAGPAGPPGAAGSLSSAYLDAYHTTGPLLVANNAPYPFDTIGASSGVTAGLGNTTFTVSSAGTYLVTPSLVTDAVVQLEVDGVAAGPSIGEQACLAGLLCSFSRIVTLSAGQAITVVNVNGGLGQENPGSGITIVRIA